MTKRLFVYGSKCAVAIKHNFFERGAANKAFSRYLLATFYADPGQ